MTEPADELEPEISPTEPFVQNAEARAMDVCVGPSVLCRSMPSSILAHPVAGRRRVDGIDKRSSSPPFRSCLLVVGGGSGILSSGVLTSPTSIVCDIVIAGMSRGIIVALDLDPLERICDFLQFWELDGHRFIWKILSDPPHDRWDRVRKVVVFGFIDIGTDGPPVVGMGRAKWTCVRGGMQRQQHMVPIERGLLEDVVATLGVLVRRGNRITNVARRLRRTIDEVLQFDQERPCPISCSRKKAVEEIKIQIKA